MDLKTAVAAMCEQAGKTLDDVKDVIPNGPQPTQLYILFTDGTYMDVQLKYPVQG